MFKRYRTQFVVENTTGAPLVHKMQSQQSSNSKNLIIGGIIIILGVFSGFLLSKNYSQKSGLSNTARIGSTGDKIVGSSDTKTFRDSAEGKLEAGGIKGEGTHKLIRPGGESQTVALTSSVLDMTQFVGKNVRIWGETFAGQSAGWFMDVGKIEVIE